MVDVLAKMAEMTAEAVEKLSNASAETKEKMAVLDKPLNETVEDNKINRFKDVGDSNLDAPLNKDISDDKPEHRCPENNGHWDGERGNSNWFPDRDYTPPEKSRNPVDNPYSNPDNLTWGELLDKYGIDSIPFKDGFPDFSGISKGTVEIENFETGGSVAKIHNFNKANEKLATEKGCTPEDVEKWMDENNYTWHECEDKKTMQKVPNEIHANIPHDGGRSMTD